MAGFFKMKYLWISGFILVSISTVKLQSNASTNGTKIGAINKFTSAAKGTPITSTGVATKATNITTLANSSHVNPRAAKPGDIINSGQIENQVVYNLDNPVFPGNNLGVNEVVQGAGGSGTGNKGDDDEGGVAHSFESGNNKLEKIGGANGGAGGAVGGAGGAVGGPGGPVGGPGGAVGGAGGAVGGPGGPVGGPGGPVGGPGGAVGGPGGPVGGPEGPVGGPGGAVGGPGGPVGGQGGAVGGPGGPVGGPGGAVGGAGGPVEGPGGTGGAVGGPGGDGSNGNNSRQGNNIAGDDYAPINGSRWVNGKEHPGEIVNSGMIHKQVVVNIENKLYPQFALNLGNQALGGLQIVCFNDTGKCALHNIAPQLMPNCTGNSNSDTPVGGATVAPIPQYDSGPPSRGPRRRPFRRTTQNPIDYEEHTTSQRRRPRRRTTTRKHDSEYPDYTDNPATSHVRVTSRKYRKTTPESDYYEDPTDDPDKTNRRTTRRFRRRTTRKHHDSTEAEDYDGTTPADYTETDNPKSSTKHKKKPKPTAALTVDYDYSDEPTNTPKRRKTTPSNGDDYLDNGPPKRTTCATVKPVRAPKKKLATVTRKPKKTPTPEPAHGYNRNGTKSDKLPAYPNSLDICFQACQSIYKDFKP